MVSILPHWLTKTALAITLVTENISNTIILKIFSTYLFLSYSLLLSLSLLYTFCTDANKIPKIEIRNIFILNRQHHGILLYLWALLVARIFLRNVGFCGLLNGRFFCFGIVWVGLVCWILVCMISILGNCRNQRKI